MPALGSSVINKSGKKFAPKAPIRRPAATTPTQTSARASVEGSRTSQTPQPETIQQAVKPPDPPPTGTPHVNANTPVPEPEPEPPREVDSHSRKRPRDDSAAREDATHTQSPSIELVTSSQQPAAQTQQPIPASTAPLVKAVTGFSQPRQSDSASSHTSQYHTTTTNTQVQEAASSGRNSQHAVTPPVPDAQPQTTHEDAPPTKRRRLKPDRATKPSAPQSRSNVQVQVSPRSTEANSNTAATTSDSMIGNGRRRRAQPDKPTKKPSTRRTGKQQKEAVGPNGVTTVRDPTRPGNDAHKNVKARKPQKTTIAANRQRLQDAAAEIVADAVEGTVTGHQARRGRGGRKAREPTPEEAENEIIAPGTIKMADLCKDTRKGKKSDMLKALQERDKEELMKKAQEELQQLVGTGEPHNPEGPGDPAGSERVENGSRAPAEEVAERQEDVVREVADTYVDEHGQIRINTDSLRIDRHAQAAAEREQVQQEAVVENDLSRPAINSATYAKREKLNSWPEELTDEFYEALQMFGTDFGMIGRMLRKTRRAIKLKFNREERMDPTRINQALLGGRIAVDLDEYSRRAGEDIKETEEHERKMEEDRKKIEENAADELRAKEEQEQLRREEAEKERAAVPDDSSGKENREAGKKRKKERKTGANREEREKKKRSRKKKGEVVAEVS
ncbi:MAG: hypothetical protein Q9225_006507 [Loekoesia sp. 1 TL-2023]